MTDKETPQNRDSSDVTRDPKRMTFPASDLGVTLKISKEAQREIDRIRRESIRAAHEVRNLAWP